MSTSAATCAVVFKAYNWDTFVERQARRMAAAAGSMDFYVLIDETAGPVGPIPFERVIRFTCADLEAAGLAMRFGAGGVLWWNPDYAHYQFLTHCPAYDYYLFVEYDCLAQCSLESFVARGVAEGADLIALPISKTFDRWHWMPYQRDVYPFHEARLALLNVCFHSSRALKLLHRRRLAMGSEPGSRHWPSSELFVPSEVVRSGMTWLSLANFGDVSRYDWFPPTLEEDLVAANGDAFLHPVLDRERYIASMLLNRGSLPPGELNRALSRFPREEYTKLIGPSARKGALKRIQHRLIRFRTQLLSHWGSPRPSSTAALEVSPRF
jgi:hypothetical protein